jgi:hypothetical protein
MIATTIGTAGVTQPTEWHGLALYGTPERTVNQMLKPPFVKSLFETRAGNRLLAPFQRLIIHGDIDWDLKPVVGYELAGPVRTALHADPTAGADPWTWAVQRILAESSAHASVLVHFGDKQVLVHLLNM